MNPYWTNGISTLHLADARELPLPDGSAWLPALGHCGERTGWGHEEGLEPSGSTRDIVSDSTYSTPGNVEGGVARDDSGRYGLNAATPTGMRSLGQAMLLLAVGEGLEGNATRVG